MGNRILGKLFVASDGLECRANRPSVLFLFSSRFLIFNTLISITKEKLLYYSSSKSSIISLIRTRAGRLSGCSSRAYCRNTSCNFQRNGVSCWYTVPVAYYPVTQESRVTFRRTSYYLTKLSIWNNAQVRFADQSLVHAILFRRIAKVHCESYGERSFASCSLQRQLQLEAFIKPDSSMEERWFRADTGWLMGRVCFRLATKTLR